MPEGIEQYVDVKNIALHLGVAKSFVYKMVSEGMLPCYRVGSRILFKVSQVDSVIEKEMKYA